jgi:hypothetical protein
MRAPNPSQCKISSNSIGLTLLVHDPRFYTCAEREVTVHTSIVMGAQMACLSRRKIRAKAMLHFLVEEWRRVTKMDNTLVSIASPVVGIESSFYSL